MSLNIEQVFSNQRLQTEQLAKQLRLGKPHTGDVLAAIDRTADMRAAFLRQKMKFEGDPNLSSTGRQGKIAELARGMMADAARVASRPRKALASLASARTALMEPTQTDRTDMVGELRRQEIRTYLRTLQPHERMAFANGAIEDEVARSAILDAPPVLVGLSDHFYGQFRTRVAEHVNGPRLEENAATANDYGLAKTASDMFRNELLKESGLTPKAFAEQMTALDAEADK